MPSWKSKRRSESKAAAAGIDRSHRKAMDRQYVDGECVWNALLRGVADLPAASDTGITSHGGLLSHLKGRLRGGTRGHQSADMQRAVGARGPQEARPPENDEVAPRARLFERAPVKWNGVPLSGREYAEVRCAVVGSRVDSKGYDCSSCDPLLVALAAAFRVNVVHQLDGLASVKYSVRNPCRVVFLRSNKNHMVHEWNLDLLKGGEPPTGADWAEEEEEEKETVSGRRESTCSFCGLMFPCEKNLKRHMERKHRELEQEEGLMQ